MRLTQILHLFRDAVEPDEAVTKAQLDALQLSGGGHTIQDEGVDLPARTRLNFTGAGVAATDDATNGQTDVTILGDAVSSVDGRTGAVSLSDLYAALVHKGRHATGGADALAPADIGAAPASHVGSRDGHPLATDAGAGFVELATQAEMDAGTAGALGITAALLKLSTAEMALVRRVAVQSIAHATATVISWDTEVSDAPGWFDAATPDRITVARAGVYLVVSTSLYAANNTGLRSMQILHNGTRVAEDPRNSATDASGRALAAALLSLAASDYVQGRTFQGSGAALDYGANTATTQAPPYLAVARLK